MFVSFHLLLLYTSAIARLIEHSFTQNAMPTLSHPATKRLLYNPIAFLHAHLPQVGRKKNAHDVPSTAHPQNRVLMNQSPTVPIPPLQILAAARKPTARKLTQKIQAARQARVHKHKATRTSCKESKICHISGTISHAVTQRFWDRSCCFASVS